MESTIALIVSGLVGTYLGVVEVRGFRRRRNGGAPVSRDICDERTKHTQESLERIETAQRDFMSILVNGTLPK